MASKYTILFLICCFSLSLGSELENNTEENNDFISSVEQKMEAKFGEYAYYLANWLKSINDKNLVNSDVGRMLHYEELEPKVGKAGKSATGRNMKKFSSVLPIIFYLGMKASWMLLTTLLAAKSVAIGLTLLVLKIAVGSAKLASYFTAWKHNHHHYEYVPHYEHHGHKRSLRSVETHLTHQDWKPHSPEYYHEAPSPYHAQPYDYEHPTERKSADKKYS